MKCPFCGSEGSMKYKEIDSNNFLVVLHCSNDKCFVHNVVSMNYDRESFMDLNRRIKDEI